MLALRKLSHKTGLSDYSDGGEREEGIKASWLGQVSPPPPPTPIAVDI